MVNSLKLPRGSRASKINTFSKMMEEHSFFKERNLNGSILEVVLMHMEILECESKQIVFEIGSQGDLFYFIIDGIVEIRIPDFENM
jgi:hypothetical protein